MQSFDMTLASSYRRGVHHANGGTPASAEAALFAGMLAGQAYFNIHTSVPPLARSAASSRCRNRPRCAPWRGDARGGALRRRRQVTLAVFDEGRASRGLSWRSAASLPALRCASRRVVTASRLEFATRFRHFARRPLVDYRTLPGTSLKVSTVCLGTMTWGEQNSETEAHAQLDFAIDRGITFIDTAEMYPVPPNSTTQGRTETLSGTVACAPASRVAGHRDEGGGTRTPRLDPQRPHRCDARRDRRCGRHEPRAAAHRLHRSLPDPLAAAKRADVRRDRVRSLEGAGRAVDSRAGRGHGGDDPGGQDPSLRAFQRDELGRVRVPPDRERARRSRTGHDAEQLQPRVARRRQRSRRSAVPREDVAARLQSARGRHPDREVRCRCEAPERALHAVRRPRQPLPQADRPRGGRCVRRAREGAWHHARAARARLRAQPLARRRDDHRRHDDAAAARGHRGRAVRASTAETLAAIQAIQVRYPNPAG